MRFFFPLELNFFLESAGFTSIRFGTFPEFDKDPDETTWNVLAVARAVRSAAVEILDWIFEYRKTGLTK